MEDQFIVERPYCGEQVEIYLEPDLGGTFVQDKPLLRTWSDTSGSA